MIIASAAKKHPLLRAALLSNAAFSSTTGLALCCFSDHLAPLLGANIAPALLLGIGAALLPFGFFAAWLGTRKEPSSLAALTVSLADLSWVAGSAALTSFAADQLTLLGVVIVLAVALCVLGFALGQLRGLARVHATDDGARFRVCFDIASDGSPERIWRNLADIGAISRFAPSLASSSLRNTSEPAPGAIRECTDTSRRQWAERCVVLDHERKELVMEFLASEPGFPFPFTAMIGGWHIQPTAAGALVRVWWEGRSKHRLLDGVILPLLAWQASRQFPSVVQALAGATAKSEDRLARLTVAPC